MTTTRPTYRGQVRTPHDAILLFEACRTGLLPRVNRRLSEKERQQIKSGSVFVWDEREAGMRRWTDGKSWSASRVSGSFLTYREMEGKRGGNLYTNGTNKKSGSKDAENGGTGSDQDMTEEGPDGYRYKPDGLMKQSFSITTAEGRHLHLISYFSRQASDGPMPTPSTDILFAKLHPQKGMYPETSVNEATSMPPAHHSPVGSQGPYPPPPPQAGFFYVPFPPHGYPPPQGWPTPAPTPGGHLPPAPPGHVAVQHFVYGPPPAGFAPFPPHAQMYHHPHGGSPSPLHGPSPPHAAPPNTTQLDRPPPSLDLTSRPPPTTGSSGALTSTASASCARNSTVTSPRSATFPPSSVGSALYPNPYAKAPSNASSPGHSRAPSQAGDAQKPPTPPHSSGSSPENNSSSSIANKSGATRATREHGEASNKSPAPHLQLPRMESNASSSTSGMTTPTLPRTQSSNGPSNVTIPSIASIMNDSATTSLPPIFASAPASVYSATTTDKQGRSTTPVLRRHAGHHHGGAMPSVPSAAAAATVAQMRTPIAAIRDVPSKLGGFGPTPGERALEKLDRFSFK